MKISLKISPYMSFLEDEQFVPCVENVEHESVITAAEYFRRIGQVCATFGTTPQNLSRLT